jgi:hypothetical protein
MMKAHAGAMRTRESWDVPHTKKAARVMAAFRLIHSLAVLSYGVDRINGVHAIESNLTKGGAVRQYVLILSPRPSRSPLLF